MLLHPYFAFDGPDCPQIKRGKGILGWSPPSLLVQRFQELLTVFGFDWHVAPGEAEAELSCLWSCGFIDAMVTPYDNALLFGATCALCSIHGDEDMEVYLAEAIENSATLEWGDLLLIMLMSSADCDTGCCWCDTDVACWLVDYGFGRTLLEAAISLQFVEFMEFIAKWYHELACVIKEEHFEFPDPTILAMYLSPLTLWSDGGHSPITHVMSHQANLIALVAFCLQCLGWPPDTVQSALMDTCAGAAMHALLQLPGNIDGEGLQCGIQVNSYFHKSLPTYRLSVPSWFLPLPVEVDLSAFVHMSLLGEVSNGNPFYEVEVPVVMLEYSRPALVQGTVALSSQPSCMELVDEDAGLQPPEPMVNLVPLIPEARVIDLTGGEDTPCLETGDVVLMRSED
ncbi:hypothetical protein F5J12DRAFT_893515 [Pisolithus orientalis]|uniref:uncharacterized protein n=1 Tax=Pisolithus orientalis TaxID=936130 RepID=UPI0022245FAF|nr:uncharacterized protein F5J12DRAFT_893515 [Pisolithus orientalis]KAI6004433.1 hypothetical protein F5J12DRAFT_893515 [Pisolithus orientalis]